MLLIQIVYARCARDARFRPALSAGCLSPLRCRRLSPTRHAAQGVLDLATGRTDMEFEADFCFTAGSLYKAPALKVATTLTSEHSAGNIHAADGRRLAADGSVL